MKEHPLVCSMILIGRVFCKVTQAMPIWGLSPQAPSYILHEYSDKRADIRYVAVVRTVRRGGAERLAMVLICGAQRILFGFAFVYPAWIS